MREYRVFMVTVKRVKYGKQESKHDPTVDILKIIRIVFFFEILMILYEREENRFWPQGRLLS